MLRDSLNASLASIDEILDRALLDPEFESAWASCRASVHLRHVYDHFDAVFLGASTGVVDYNHRTRDCPAENSAEESAKRHRAIRSRLAHLRLDDASLIVISETHVAMTEVEKFKSNLKRECLYLINHTVHHLAQCKVLLSQAGFELDESVGLAPATASYQRQLSEQG